MSYSSTVLATAGLHNYWHFDETSGTSASDSKGSVNLTYHGSFTLNVTALASGSAVTFNGTTGYASAGTTTTTATSSVTLEAWIKLASVTQNNQYVIINGAPASNGYGLVINSGTTDGTIAIVRGGHAWTNTPIRITDTTYPHHLVLVINASGVPEIFLDGCSVYTGIVTAFDTPTDFCVGGDGSNFFNGTIDEPAYYTAMVSASDIWSHWQAANIAAPTGVKKGRTLASGDFLQAPYSSDFDNGSDNYITFSITFKTTQSASFVCLFARNNSGSKNGFTLYSNSGTMTLQVKDSGGSQVLSIGSTIINNGSQHTVVVRLSNTTSLLTDIWMDGSQIASGTPSGAWSFSGDYLRWGTAQDTFWGHFVGDFFTSGWWKRKLTDSEIKFISKGALPTAFKSNLSACWQMGGYGPYETDEINSHNAWANGTSQSSTVPTINPAFNHVAGGAVMEGFGKAVSY